MIKTLTAIALAAATLAMPAAAQDAVKAPTASVVPPVTLPSSGLAAAGVAAGVGIIAIIGIAVIASDDDDDPAASGTGTGTGATGT